MGSDQLNPGMCWGADVFSPKLKGIDPGPWISRKSLPEISSEIKKRPFRLKTAGR
jgi:hypothetical protein